MCYTAKAMKMKENRSNGREKQREQRRAVASPSPSASVAAAAKRKGRRGKVLRKRGKRTVVEGVWARCQGEWRPTAAATKEVLARRPWLESKALKTTGKRKTVVRGVSPRRRDHRRGRWRRKEARKRVEKGGVSRAPARAVERVAAASAGSERTSPVKAQRDQRHKLAKQS